MDLSTSFVSPPSSRGNRLVDYLQTLAKAKKGLPYSVPVCVSPSHTINTTDSLIDLASLVGPYIAILQVHADVIDDWSDETVRQLTLLAKRHSFLIWESGRILNSSVDVVGRQKAETREVRNELVDLTRKKYTRGVIKPASWAGLATAWASGVAVDSQEVDILIPTLRAAAREAVADRVGTIRTEITADPSINMYETESMDDEDDGAVRQHLSPDFALDENDHIIPLRKVSTISLTQTITQYTEDSTELLLESENPIQINDLQDGTQETSPTDTLPPPPLLARGLVLCLPSTTDSSFTPEYRKSCIAAARANQDFVVGFLSIEAWPVVSQRGSGFDMDLLGYDEKDGVSASDEARPPLAVISSVPHRVTPLGSNRLDDDGDSDEETMSPTRPIAQNSPVDLNPLAAKLHAIIGQAIKFRNESIKSKGGRSNSRSGSKVLHIPLVSLP